MAKGIGVHSLGWAAVLAVIGAGPYLQAQEVPSPVAFKAIEDVVYGHKDGLALTMDVLTPETNAKNLGIVLVSSGSWRSGKSDLPGGEQQRRQGEHWVQGLLKGGYTLFIARHGSTPRYRVPEMIEDIRRSVRFVRLHARDYGVDPAHLGITSGSSGAHLALSVGLTGDDGKTDSRDPVERMSCRVQAIVAWFAPTDLVNWGNEGGYKFIELARPGLFKDMFGEIKDLESQLKSISPAYFVTRDDPPLLMIHGDADTTVPVQQSKLLKAKCDEAGLTAQLIVHPGGGHRTWPGIMDQYPDVWKWFDKYLQVKPPVSGAGR